MRNLIWQRLQHLNPFFLVTAAIGAEKSGFYPACYENLGLDRLIFRSFRVYFYYRNTFFDGIWKIIFGYISIIFLWILYRKYIEIIGKISERWDVKLQKLVLGIFPLLLFWIISSHERHAGNSKFFTRDPFFGLQLGIRFDFGYISRLKLQAWKLFSKGTAVKHTKWL